MFELTCKAQLSPGGETYFFAVLERVLKERGLSERGLLIIQGKKCYITAFMHFFCIIFMENCTKGFKTLLTLVNYIVLIIRQVYH